MSRVVTTSVVALALVAAIACGKSEEEKQAEELAKTAESGAAAVAEGAAAMAKGLEQMAQGAGAAGKVEVVPFETLSAALPEVSGWQRGEVNGRTMSMPFPMSQSEATYEQGEGRIEVEVIDTAMNQMLIAPFSMFLVANYNERSTDGYRKGTTVKGQPGFEDVNTTDKTADITVVVHKRFIVHARGRDVSGVEPVRALLERMDFGKLAAK